MENQVSVALEELLRLCPYRGHPIDRASQLCELFVQGILSCELLLTCTLFQKSQFSQRRIAWLLFVSNSTCVRVIITWPPFTHKPTVAQLNLAPGGEKKRLFLWSNKCQSVRCVTSDSPVSRLMDLLSSSSSASLVFSRWRVCACMYLNVNGEKATLNL